jgi:3-hydroxybenzoate 6-monooxygenase
MRPMIVVGGGIGGLSVALGFAGAGIKSIVVEQTHELGEIGAGIQIAPNAFHCFDYLGVGDEMRKAAVFIEKLQLMDAVTGAEIVRIPLDEPFRRRFKSPYAVVHRADLHNALYAAARSSGLVDFRTSHRVTKYEQNGSSVRIYCNGRDPIEGRALIGADGLRSRIRAQMLNDGPPRVSGHTTYRSVLPMEEMPEDLRWNAATLWAGPKCHIVHYPLKGWKVFNLVVTCHDDVKEAVAGVPVAGADVKRCFEHLHSSARKIIEHGSNWKLWVLCDRDPVEKWVDGRVTLLGDAAHPMLQYFAQGACMALEDGVWLSHLVVAHSGDIEKAFAAYQKKRVGRAGRVQIDARLIGEYIYHPAGVTAQVRNEIMQSLTADQYYDRLEWLYGNNGLPEVA